MAVLRLKRVFRKCVAVGARCLGPFNVHRFCRTKRRKRRVPGIFKTRSKHFNATKSGTQGLLRQVTARSAATHGDDASHSFNCICNDKTLSKQRLAVAGWRAIVSKFRFCWQAVHSRSTGLSALVLVGILKRNPSNPCNQETKKKRVGTRRS